MLLLKTKFYNSKKQTKSLFSKTALYVPVRNLKNCGFVVLPFVQLLAQALRQMHCKAGGCFQTVAVKAELLFFQPLEFVALSETPMALPAENIVYGERGYCCDPYFVHGPKAKQTSK